MKGSELRDARINLGWSQWRLADYLLTSQTRVYRWEAADEIPVGPHLFAIEKFMEEAEAGLLEKGRLLSDGGVATRERNRRLRADAA